MAFPTLAAQQETNRRILEDLQLKKQLIQKGIPPASIGLGATAQALGSMPVAQQLGQPLEFSQVSNTPPVPRSVFNPNTSNTTGFFIPQDSFYGNSFLPVLPRLDPVPLSQVSK